MDPDAKKLLQVASRYSYLGIFFGVAIIVGYGLGRFLDTRWGTTPWLSIIGLLVGVVSGFRELNRVAQQSIHEQQDDDPPPPPST